MRCLTFCVKICGHLNPTTGLILHKKHLHKFHTLITVHMSENKAPTKNQVLECLFHHVCMNV
jgi:hypothetical protein